LKRVDPHAGQASLTIMATVDLPCHGYGFGSTVAWNRERSIT
jgi:hypothetical protein